MATKYFPSAQSTFHPPLIANENAYLGDIVSSSDAEKPISAGFFRLTKGTPLEYTYTYHETKIILSGSFTINDNTTSSTPTTYNAKAGDVLYFPKGAKITFSTEEEGLAFYTGQRKEGGA